MKKQNTHESCIICFPNQLFDVEHWIALKIISNASILFVIDDPVFYGDRRGNRQKLPKRLQLNHLRVCYQLATVESFVTSMRKKNIFQEIKHISFDDIFDNGYDAYLNGLHDIHAYDPMDHLLKHKLRNLHITYHDSPSFILGRNDIEQFIKARVGKKLQQKVLFETVKRKLDYLVGVKSYDTMNRKAFPKGEQLPDEPHLERHKMHTYSGAEWEHMWLTVATHKFFKSNAMPANKERALECLKRMPLSSADAHTWLKKFVHERFTLFGKYEDAIVNESQYLYHSGISVFLNNGLLTPHDVLSVLQKQATNIPMQSREAFVRQLFGWREYARLYYEVVPISVYQANVFQMPRKKLAKAWYEGSTDIPIVNKAIQDGFTYGYLHHIRRLMIVANYMTLCNIHPTYIYKWMYEFSLDSWDWVMIFNCFSMASWSDGGHGMRKPYISSAEYILKMSDEPRGPWEDVWNAKFKAFLEKHAEILRHTPYAMFLKNK